MPPEGADAEDAGGTPSLHAEQDLERGPVGATLAGIERGRQEVQQDPERQEWALLTENEGLRRDPACRVVVKRSLIPLRGMPRSLGQEPPNPIHAPEGGVRERDRPG